VAPSRRDGGLLPQIGWGSMDEVWDDVVFRLKPEEISAPFMSRGVWQIVQMISRTPVDRPDYEKAYPKLRGILLNRKLDARKRDLSTALFQKFNAALKLLPFDLATYSTALAKDSQTVVATWNGGTLTIEDLSRKLNFDSLKGLTPEQVSFTIETQLRELVDLNLYYLEAISRHFDTIPEIALKARQTKEETMETILYAEHIFKNVTVTENELRERFDTQTDKLSIPETRIVSQILVPTQEEALAARERISRGESFESLAKSLSKDKNTASKGGDLGRITQKEVPPGWEQVFKLFEGDTSTPLQSKFGWHLIRVTKIEPPRTPSFDEVKEELKRKMVLAKRTDARNNWLKQLRAAAKIKIDDAAVRAFAAENAKPAVEAPPASPH
jgi:parvulin-like peptidyl-prolyl isomerase